LCFAITKQSLWIDEGCTAWLAAQNSLRHLIEAVLSVKGSDAQTPLYVLYMWAWAKVFGTGEYALRASNIPFALMLTAALGWTSSRLFRRPILWTVFCLSPFVAFYINEAKAYLPVTACAAISMAAMLAYFADRARYGKIAPWACFFALVIACGIQMLAAFLVPVLVVYAALACREKHPGWKTTLHDWGRPLAVNAPILVALGAYYLYTVMAGYGGARGRPGLGNIAFAVYEFMGLGGLGPPRNELRADPSIHTLVPYLPWLMVGILACVAAFGTAAARVFCCGQKKPNLSLFAGLAVGLTLFLVAARLVWFRFWGRHLAVFFPSLVFGVIQVTGETTEVTKRLRAMERVAFIFLAIVWVVSDARLLLDPHYYKDDYRFAAHFALEEANRTGGTIAWAAAPMAGRYYAIQLAQTKPGPEWPVRGEGVWAANWTSKHVLEYLAFGRRRKGVILVLSKPDLYDRHGAWSAAVAQMKPCKVASANAFDIYAFR
jgi:hypothetical protein